MKALLSAWDSLVKCEEGQSTTEYILMLSMAVVLVLMLVRKLIEPMFSRLMTSVEKRIDKSLFSSDSFHSLRL